MDEMDDKKMSVGEALGIGLAVGVLLLVGFAFGWLVGFHATEEDRPVCYASTEDSNVVGCDYRNGAWYAE